MKPTSALVKRFIFKTVVRTGELGTTRRSENGERRRQLGRVFKTSSITEGIWYMVVPHLIPGGAVANRLRRRTSDQMVLGSNPAALSPWTRLFTTIVPRRSLHISFY